MLGYGVLSSITKYKNITIAATIRSKSKLKKIKKDFPYNKIKNFYYLDVLKIKEEKLKKILNKYDYIINCIGVIKPEIDKNDQVILNKKYQESYLCKFNLS